MKIFIKSNMVKYITLGFATAITLYPFVIIRKKTILNKSLVIHEKIHLRQQIELLVLPFYVWYCVEFCLRYLKYRNQYEAYKNISFEKEAYTNENDAKYLEKRKYFAWVLYL
jgi:hypothetical protein